MKIFLFGWASQPAQHSNIGSTSVFYIPSGWGWVGGFCSFADIQWVTISWSRYVCCVKQRGVLLGLAFFIDSWSACNVLFSLVFQKTSHKSIIQIYRDISNILRRQVLCLLYRPNSMCGFTFALSMKILSLMKTAENRIIGYAHITFHTGQVQPFVCKLYMCLTAHTEIVDKKMSY